MSEDSGEQEVPERGRVQGANRMKAALLTVTGLLGIASCYLVTRRTAEAEFRDERGIEQLSIPGEFYVHTAPYMYAAPVLLWRRALLWACRARCCCSRLAGKSVHTSRYKPGIAS